MTTSLLDGSSGHLEREMPAHWEAPRRVELKRGSLYFDWSESGKRRLGLGVLTGFAELAEARDREILDYAKRWGALGLCLHDLPASHQASYRKIESTDLRGWFHGLCRVRGHFPHTIETLQSWRFFAVYIRAALGLAHALRIGEPGSEADWRKLAQCRAQIFKELEPEPVGAEVPTRANEGWKRVSFSLNQLLDLASLQILARFEYHHEPGVPSVITKLVLVGRDQRALFPVLATETMLAVADRKILACSGCPRLFGARRRPVTGEQVWCPECGKRAAWRAASRRYYASKKSKRN